MGPKDEGLYNFKCFTNARVQCFSASCELAIRATVEYPVRPEQRIPDETLRSAFKS